MIIDTHAHYDDEDFNEDRHELLTSLKDNNIELVVNIGASIKTTRNTIELMEKYPFIYGALGVHPSETAELNEDNFSWLKEQFQLEKVVAVGEIGLDYYWDEPAREIQKYWFEKQLDLARDVKKPVVIHSRDAANDTLTIMKEKNAKDLGGIIHCFSYGKEMAREYLNMGFYLGIGGVVTFQNAKNIKEVVEYVPMESIVLETDAPYLSPVPFRGKRNSSLNLTHVVNQIATIKGMEYDEVVRITNENAKKVYNIS